MALFTHIQKFDAVIYYWKLESTAVSILVASKAIKQHISYMREKILCIVEH